MAVDQRTVENRHSAGPSDGSESLSAIVTTDRAFLAAIVELAR